MTVKISIIILYGEEKEIIFFRRRGDEKLSFPKEKMAIRRL